VVEATCAADSVYDGWWILDSTPTVAMSVRLDDTRARAIPLLLVLASACDPVTTVRTTARGTRAVEYSCAFQATEVEFRDAHVRGEPTKNRIMVGFAPDGAMTLAPIAPGKAELSAESIWFGRPKSEKLATMEGLQRRAIKAILGRCGQLDQVRLFCWSSRGPVSGDTCFGPSASK